MPCKSFCKARTSSSSSNPFNENKDVAKSFLWCHASPNSFISKRAFSYLIYCQSWRRPKRTRESSRLKGRPSGHRTLASLACRLNQLWLFLIIIRTGNSTTGSFLKLFRCDAKLISQKIRLELHNFSNIFRLHKPAGVLERCL